MGTVSQIKELLGNAGYIDNPQDMEMYLESWRGGHKGSTSLVAFPTTTEQVTEIVKICAGAQMPIVPQGGNTGLVGGAIPSSEGNEFLINLSRMNNIRKLDKNSGYIIAEAGCILQNIQECAADAGFLFPLSIGSEGSCQVGGIVSTNAGGNAVLHYGNMRDLVLGLEVVLPNGKVISSLERPRKDNTGYDLKHLFIGAEGTLGIITAASLKLFPAPKQIATAFLAVDNIDDAVGLLARLKAEIGDVITAFELISADALELVVEHISGARNPFASKHKYYILAEFSTSLNLSDDWLRTQVEQVLYGLIEAGKVKDAVLAESLAQAQDFWHIREHISQSVKQAGRGIHFDISLPVGNLAAFFKNTDRQIAKYDGRVKLVPFGHLGDGNIHYNMYMAGDIADSEFTKHKSTLQDIVYPACVKYGGSISAEHGIGVERKAELHKYKPESEIHLMQQIKSTLDPDNIMNPGKVVETDK